MFFWFQQAFAWRDGVEDVEGGGMVVMDGVPE